MKDALYKIKDYCQSHPGCKDCYFDKPVSAFESRCFIRQFMVDEDEDFHLPYIWGMYND